MSRPGERSTTHGLAPTDKIESVTMLLRVQPVAEARPMSVFARTPKQEVHAEAPTLGTSA